MLKYLEKPLALLPGAFGIFATYNADLMTFL